MFEKVVCIKNCYGILTFNKGTFCHSGNIYYRNNDDKTENKYYDGVDIHGEKGEYLGYFNKNNFLSMDLWRDRVINEIME